MPRIKVPGKGMRASRYRSRHVNSAEYRKFLRIRDIKFLLQGQLCFWCEQPITRDVGDGHPSKLTGDHIVAISKGGSTHYWNVVASCWKCNHEKSEQEWKEANDVQSGVYSLGPGVWGYSGGGSDE